jgi:hypothetical protein
MIYAGRVLREIVTRPVSAAIALIELPATVNRSLREANELMETSRRQLESMQRQTTSALNQAERMNDLLSRVVRLTEPIEKAQRGGEYVAVGLRKVIFGDGLERAVEDAEAAAGDAERAALEAEEAADEADESADEADEAADEAGGVSDEADDELTDAAAGEPPAKEPGTGL